MSQHQTPEKTEESPAAEAASSQAPDDSGREAQGLVATETAEQAEAAGQAEAASTADAAIVRIEAELEQVRDLLRRKQAEFENYRKRVERERQEFAAYAAAELVREILPVVDNLERALTAAEPASESRLREGLEIIYRQFRDILKKVGLREVEALGKVFDPHEHEAVAHLETTEYREGAVVEVLQKGYFLKERLLRPAMVKVAKGREAPAGEPAQARAAEGQDQRHSEPVPPGSES